MKRRIISLNIQIFGKTKCFDTKKAERYFKERGIKYQYIDMKEKGMSKGELNTVCQAVGGLDKLLDDKCRDKDALALIRYISEEDSRSLEPRLYATGKRRRLVTARIFGKGGNKEWKKGALSCAAHWYPGRRGQTPDYPAAHAGWTAMVSARRSARTGRND